MKYKLNVYGIWEQGPREKQEDSMFPAYGKASAGDRLFILCDGMGGHSAGEVASRTVCEAMGASILSRCASVEGGFADDDFRAGLADAFDALDEHDNGAAKKMGTTLTFLKLHDCGATIAHIGDSRVYHIRPGRGVDDTAILFQTEDHSLVNDLVRVGELTREEAKVSKQKNIITRAMQPGMERRPKADMYHTHDIRPGDYFMLCSDGILEQMEDDNLKYIFSAKGGDAANKVDMLIKVTRENHDNHSAILVHITDVVDPLPVDVPASAGRRAAAVEPLMAQVEEGTGSVRSVRADDRARNIGQRPSGSAAGGSDDSRRKNSRRLLVPMLVAVAVAAIVSAGYYLYIRPGESAATAKAEAGQTPATPPSPKTDPGSVRHGSAPASPAAGQTPPAAGQPAPAQETPSATENETPSATTQEHDSDSEPQSQPEPQSQSQTAQTPAVQQPAQSGVVLNDSQRAAAEEVVQSQRSSDDDGSDVVDSDSQRLHENITKK